MEWASELSTLRPALILWEHTITFCEEIQFIWRRGLSAVTVLFVVNRYSVLWYGALNIIAGLVSSTQVCIFLNENASACGFIAGR